MLKLLVKELRGNSELPEKFIDTLLEICPDCGSDMQISDSLRELSCSNPYCKGKVVQRMVSLLADMGVKNMGESRCMKFIEETGLKYPASILQWEPVDGDIGDLSADFLSGIKEQIDSHRSMMLWEYIKYSNIPYLRDTARELFKGYNDLKQFYAILESYGDHGVFFIQDILKIKDEGVISIRALNIYTSLVTYKEELLYGINFVNIIVPQSTLNVCISTSVGNGYSSKADFVNKMNQRYGDICHINFLSSVTKNCDYLIWSKQGAPTSKVNKASKYGISILTGEEFERMLRGKYND